MRLQYINLQEKPQYTCHQIEASHPDTNHLLGVELRPPKILRKGEVSLMQVLQNGTLSGSRVTAEVIS